MSLPEVPKLPKLPELPELPEVPKLPDLKKLIDPDMIKQVAGNLGKGIAGELAKGVIGKTPAGKILTYVYDYLGLIILLVVIFIIYFFIKNGFPRMNGMSHAENMDTFLSEKNFLNDNIVSLLQAKLPSYFELFIGNKDAFNKKRHELRHAIEELYANDVEKAVRQYFIFYNIVNKSSNHTIYVNGNVRSTKYKKFYDAYVIYSSLTGELDTTGMSESEKIAQVYMMDFPSTTSENTTPIESSSSELEKDQDYLAFKKSNKLPQRKSDTGALVHRIKICGQLIEEFTQLIINTVKEINANNLLYMVSLPPNEDLKAIAKQMLIHKDPSIAYKADFKYSNVNEYLWHYFEAMNPDTSMISYDSNLKYIIVNYLNSDYETRQKARNILIKSDELCDFLDKHPILSKVHFSDAVKNKTETYQRLKKIYSLMKVVSSNRSASNSLDQNEIEDIQDTDVNNSQSGGIKSFYQEMVDLKMFINYTYIAYLYFYIYRNQHKRYNRHTITSIYEQKFKTNSEFFLEMMKPHAEDLWHNRIVMPFLRMFTKDYWEGLYEYAVLTYMKLGEMIMNIPFSVADNIQNKRGFKVEKFQQIKHNTYEGFLGGLFAPIIAIGKFFMGIVKITMVIVQLFIRFTKDPFGVLIDIFMLLISTLISILLVIIYGITTLPPLIWIIHGVIVVILFIWDLVKFVIGLWYNVVFLIIAFFIVAFLTTLNFMFRGKINSWIQCQNSPAAWYKTPNYQYRNVYERTLMCSKPCPTGYRTSESGLLCLPIPDGHPNYCPQAAVMRIYTGHKRNDFKYSYPDYQVKGNVKYELSLPSKREKKLLDHFKIGRKFFQVCEKPMQNYLDISRGICSNIDAIKAAKPFNMSDEDIRRLERVCRQSYCNSKGTYGFCNKYRDFNEDDNTSSLIKNICMIIFSIVMFTVISIIVVYVAMEGSVDQIFSFSLPKPKIPDICKGFI